MKLFKKKKEEYIQVMKEYVEGKININEIKKLIEHNETFIELLKTRFDFEYIAYKDCDYNIYNYLIKECPLEYNWDTIEIRVVVYYEFERYLKWFNIPYDASYTKYMDDRHYVQDIQPSWLDINDTYGIFDKIIEEAPKDISKTKKIAYGKAKLKELFKYDKTYPRWIQAPEWPIINGKPLVFSHQSKEKKDDERVYYYFYDPDTKEETVVMQMY